MIWHVIIRLDNPMPVVFHECDPHKEILKSLECTCDDEECNLTPPTPCNCRRPVPCGRCAGGETPAMSQAIAVSLQAQR